MESGAVFRTVISDIFPQSPTSWKHRRRDFERPNDRGDATDRELMMWMHGPKLIVSTQDSTETVGPRVRGWGIGGDRHEG
jgi:hypothetical protein